MLEELDRLSLGPLERRALELELVERLTSAKAYALNQVHGTLAVRIQKDTPAGAPYPEADALYSSESGVVLVVRTADCMPLFFVVHGDRPVCGVIHAGWRGLAAGIISKTLLKVLNEMQAEGSRTDSIDLFTGPCISGEAYEVGPEVASHFELVLKTESRPHVDLLANAALEIERFGAARNIGTRLFRDFFACTAGENSRYYSHRKGDTGRNLNILHIR